MINNIVFKTRRSNSLTINNDHFPGATLTASTENLPHLQKQRSFSLSIENPRFLMPGSGSETRLDDLKSYQTFQTQNPGMKHVGVWLKKLRLHKYQDIFRNFTFEQMMDIDDTFLEQLNVTQGARTKLVTSIKKLKERYARMLQAEQDLQSGHITAETAIQMLLEFVDTPMKPIDIYDTTDVASQFLRLLDLGKFFSFFPNRRRRTEQEITHIHSNFLFFYIWTVCNIMNSKPIEPQDEEPLEQLLQILNTTNTEPFLPHAMQLKDWQFKIGCTKMKNFAPKNHYHKNGNGLVNGNSNKSR